MTQPIPMSGQATCEATCTLKSVDDGIARIIYNSLWKPTGSALATQMLGAQMNYNKLEFRGAGTIQFDVVNGSLAAWTVDRDDTTESTVSKPGQAEATVTTRHKARTVLTVREGTAADMPAPATEPAK